MHPGHSFLLALPVVAVGLLASPDAAACGGCFHEPGEAENTQVTGHRMIFSISQKETTLWDQFSYAGSPTSFAWVLPVKGTATIGLSSDVVFGYLDQFTGVTVSEPNLPCLYEGYGGSGGAASTTGAAVAAAADDFPGSGNSRKIGAREAASSSSNSTSGYAGGSCRRLHCGQMLAFGSTSNARMFPVSRRMVLFSVTSGRRMIWFAFIFRAPPSAAAMQTGSGR